MGWSDGQYGGPPLDVNEQFVHFARSGELVPLDEQMAGRARNSPVSTAALAIIALCGFTGLVVTATALVGGVDESQLTIGALTLIVAAALSVPAGYLAHSQRMTPPAVQVSAASILPPELLRAGHWIHCHGAWARIDEIGPLQDETVSALISTGDLIQISKPVAVAGGVFRPSADPTYKLRS